MLLFVKEEDHKAVSDESHSIPSRINEEFIIRLPATPSTGYTWQVEQMPQKLHLLGTNYEQSEHNITVVGSSEMQLFRFYGTAPGQYDIVFALKRPWENSVIQKRTIRVYIK